MLRHEASLLSKHVFQSNKYIFDLSYLTGKYKVVKNYDFAGKAGRRLPALPAIKTNPYFYILTIIIIR
jgi:hypothetical protein